MRDLSASEGLPEKGEQDQGTSPNFGHSSNAMRLPVSAAGISKMKRVAVAYERYGWRVFPIGVYRILFQWPRLRSKFISWKIRWLLKSKIGSQVRFGKNISMWIPGGYLEVGNQTSFMDRCMILVSPNPAASVRIGENCYFANDVNICAYGEISIGNNVRIAEFTSVRDASHTYYARNLRIDQQGEMIGTISIGDDVWIGQGSLLVAEGNSLRIGKGVVIGAHSLVKNSIPDYAVAVGSPARIVRYRTDETVVASL